MRSPGQTSRFPPGAPISFRRNPNIGANKNELNVMLQLVSKLLLDK